jgi:hypothetical protein
MIALALPRRMAIPLRPAVSWAGGRWVSGLISALFAALLASGLVLEWGPEGGDLTRSALVLAHLAGGLGFVLIFAPWALRHARHAPAESQRRLFSLLGWALLAKYVVVLATGLLMTLPPALWLAGQVWFWPMAATRVLAFLHLWLSLAAIVGLALHLMLRHWRR